MQEHYMRTRKHPSFRVYEFAVGRAGRARGRAPRRILRFVNYRARRGRGAHLAEIPSRMRGNRADRQTLWGDCEEIVGRSRCGHINASPGHACVGTSSQCLLLAVTQVSGEISLNRSSHELPLLWRLV
eukprot:5031489-Pleurochrysis_carterae.AAC.2